MRNIRVWVVLCAVATTTTAFADDQWYEGKLKYTWGGVTTLFDKPDAACQAGVKELAKNGNHQQFVSVKEGPAPGMMTCVLKDLDSKAKTVWDEENLITKHIKCLDGSDGISKDNSGTFEAIKCKCDPVKGCPGKLTGPTERKPFSCPAKNADNPVCKAKKAPPGIEHSDRCTQKTSFAKPVSQPEADAQSKTNRDKMSSTPDGKEMVARYTKALGEIRKDEEDKKAMRTGKDSTGKEFPKFTKDDMCETNTPTDVNIGMPCGSREADFAAANNIAGLTKTPSFENAPNIDCVWHHHEDLGRMQLVKRKAHQDEPHTGGVKVWEQAMGIPDYPLCCP